VHQQVGARVRLEWAAEGVAALAPDCAVLVVVDVLSFTTSVDVALSRGARVLPLRSRDAAAVETARRAGAVLAAPSNLTGGAAADRRPNLGGTGGGTSAHAVAGGAGDGTSADPAAGETAGAVPADAAGGAGDGWTLRPASLRSLPAGLLLALPSPNGAMLSVAAAATGATVLAGCLRNATAVARAAVAVSGGGSIGVVPAGERWGVTSGPLRPALEDLLGAGAIVSALLTELDASGPPGRTPGREPGLAPGWTPGPAVGPGLAPGPGPGVGFVQVSVEARVAAAGFRAVRGELAGVLADCASGRELIAAGHRADVALAAELDVSAVAPVLVEGVYQPHD
jgi:2-phosphosulfolactate phosphatase